MNKVCIGMFDFIKKRFRISSFLVKDILVKVNSAHPEPEGIFLGSKVRLCIGGGLRLDLKPFPKCLGLFKKKMRSVLEETMHRSTTINPAYAMVNQCICNACSISFDFRGGYRYG